MSHSLLGSINGQLPKKRTDTVDVTKTGPNVSQTISKVLYPI